MKFKLDENLSTLVVALLRALGHDVDSVFQEGLSDTELDHDIETAGSRRSIECPGERQLDLVGTQACARAFCMLLCDVS